MEQVKLITDDLAEAGVPLARAHEVLAVGGPAPGGLAGVGTGVATS
jgi:hypothetical protein